MYCNDVCSHALQALGAPIPRTALAIFHFTPNPWSGWTCLVQLLEFWQISIAIYVCLVMAYLRVRASLYNYSGSHPMCYVLSFKLVVHAFSIVCMLAAITRRHMIQMLWQRTMHLGL